jgi:hypothetical protein
VSAKQFADANASAAMQATPALANGTRDDGYR